MKRKKKLFFGWVLFLFFMIIFLYNLFSLFKNYWVYNEKKQEYEKIKKTIEIERAKKEEVDESLKKMDQKEYIEDRLIDRYKLKYKGEEVIEFIE